MKKIWLLLMLFVAPVHAEELKLYVPHSAGGAVSVLANIARPYFAAQGIELDVKLMGNCVLAKKSFDESQGKMLTVWYRDLDKIPECKLATNESNFLTIAQLSVRYVCSLDKKTLADFRTAGKTYTVGWNSLDPKQFFDEISSVDKTAFKLLPYKNFGELQVGMQAKEMDFVFTPGGVDKIRENGGDCFFSTSVDGVNTGVPVVKDYYPTHKFGDLNNADWFLSKNLSPSDVEKIRSIIKQAQDSIEWKTYAKSRDIIATDNLTLDRQLTLVITGK